MRESRFSHFFRNVVWLYILLYYYGTLFMPLVASFCPAKTPVSPRSKSSPITLRIHDKQKQFRLHDSFALKYQNGRNEEDKLELEEEESDADSWYMRLLSKYKRSNNSEIDDTDSETEAIRTVHNLDEVRHALLVDKTNTLKDLDFAPDFAALRTNDTTQIVNATTATKEQLSHHPVLQLLAQRVATNSTPGNRAKGDTAHLALAIEGGGMRGSVSAGMAAAIATLGLTDAFDSVYGSSAGSIVGSYMISRQMCIDVYTQVLPAAKEKFACRRRVVRNLGVGLVNDLVQRLGQASPSSYFSWNENATSADNKTSTSDIETTRQTSEEMASITSRLAALMARFTPTILSNSMPALVSSLQPYLTLSPGMNISFVLEGVMSEQHGLRPFDMESFRRNDAKQPLYAVASTVRDGKLETVAFSSKEGDYFDIEVQNETMPTDNTIFVPEGKIRRAFRLVKRGVVKVGKLPLVVYRTVKKIFGRENSTDSTSNGKRNSTTKKARFVTADKSPLFRRFAKEKPTLNVVQKMENGTLIRQASACPDESGKKGFFACIESSMLVPGAAGPPVRLLRSKYRKDAQSLGIDRMASVCFDAFCYEPIPYRSAVENGATHVLALRSRPDGCFVETVPGVYENWVAAVYFRLNRLPQVARFFESGGSQYRYLEDILTLDEALSVGCTEGNTTSNQGVKVPPTDILFGTEYDNEVKVDIDSWKRAHMLPVVLPAGTPELPSLTQDKDEVLLAVRNGFAAAFDMLAPIAALDFDPSTVDSKKIAELLFPRNDDEEDLYVLETPVNVKGDFIRDADIEMKQTARRRFADWIRRKRKARQKDRWKALRNPFRAVAVEVERGRPGTKQYVKEDSLDWLEAEALLAMLPGFQGGRLSYLSGELRSSEDAQGEKSRV